MFFFPPIMALTEQIGAIKDDESEARLIPPPPSFLSMFSLPSTLNFGG
jgi:hypothetical protein